MIIGESVPRTIFVQNDSGAFVSYANYAAFQAAGFAITFYGPNGVALASQPTITLPVAGANGRHQFAFTMPSGIWTAYVSGSNPLLFATPVEFYDEGTIYDIDAVGSSIATSSGVAISDTTFTNSVEMFDGNSIDISCSVADSALAKIGAANLAACTLLAEIKLNSLDSSVAASVGTLAETITSDTSGNRVVRVTLDTFPAALAVPAGSQQSVQATLQLKLTNGAKSITANATQITVRWKATTT
jgi:hypothetical protein